MITGKYFIRNTKTLSTSVFSDPFRSGIMSVYEVIRIDEGIPLFLEDHIERLKKSFDIAGKELNTSHNELKNQILKLISLNKIQNGLLHIVFCFHSDNIIDSCIYQSAVTFPSVSLYRKGVSCELMFAERKSPLAKIYNPSVREKANRIINRHKIFETILVNSENRITEGSRSNLFFIKDDTIVTAPDNTVLSGITRKKVVGIIEQLGIALEYDLPEVGSLKDFEAVFLTGTTPKVMPVKNIEKISFNTNHHFISGISDEYNRIIESYKKTFADDQEKYQ